MNQYGAGTTVVRTAGSAGTSFWYPCWAGVKTTTTNLIHVKAYCINETNNTYRVSIQLGVAGGTMYYPNTAPEGDDTTAIPYFDIELGATYFENSLNRRIRFSSSSATRNTILDVDADAQEVGVVYKDASGNVIGKKATTTFTSVNYNVDGKILVGWYDQDGNKMENGQTISRKTIVHPIFADRGPRMISLTDVGLNSSLTLGPTDPAVQAEDSYSINTGNRIDFYMAYQFISQESADNYFIFALNFDYIDAETRTPSYYDIELGANYFSGSIVKNFVRFSSNGADRVTIADYSPNESVLVYQDIDGNAIGKKSTAHDQVEAMTMGDRIVVMKDGFIQQIDTPKNLYRYPMNKFVANFIGTPQMNFTDVVLSNEKEKVRIDVKGTETSFLVPREYLLKVDPIYFDGETVVSFAIRPEYLSRDKKVYPYSCKAKIVSVEELGTETQLMMDFDLERDILSLGNDDENIKSSLTIKTDADYDGKVNDVIEISLDLEHMHLFDSIDEEVINPHLPNHARVKGVVKDNKLQMMGLSLDLPSAINLENDTYNVYVPLDAIKVDKSKKDLSIYKVEQIGDKYLLSFFKDGEVLFALSDEEFKEKDKVGLEISLRQLDFYKEKELVLSHLNVTNELEGMVYYHKEKDESGKKVKVLDYLIDDLELPCHNPIGYRSFIDNKDRSVYDLDMIFKFKANEIHIAEDGVFELKVKEIINFDVEKYALCEYKEQNIVILLNKEEELEIGQEIKANVDVDNIEVFDKVKGIKLV